jgi:hypothetical protein
LTITRKEIEEQLDALRDSRSILQELQRHYDNGVLTKHEMCLHVAMEADRLEPYSLRETLEALPELKPLMLEWLRDVGNGAAVGNSNGPVSIRGSSRIQASLLHDALSR